MRLVNYLHDLDLDLNLDSARIQLDTLGHPCLSRAATSASSQVNPIFRSVGLCWLRPSSSLLIDLVLSCILVPASTVLAVVCACGPYARHDQASEVVFLSVCYLWFVVQLSTCMLTINSVKLSCSSFLPLTTLYNCLIYITLHMLRYCLSLPAASWHWWLLLVGFCDWQVISGRLPVCGPNSSLSTAGCWQTSLCSWDACVRQA